MRHGDRLGQDDLRQRRINPIQIRRLAAADQAEGFDQFASLQQQGRLRRDGEPSEIPAGAAS
ncbi:hypothetical protein D3C73_1552240 [compost metagenome]